jgi:hypothetical protein
MRSNLAGRPGELLRRNVSQAHPLRGFELAALFNRTSLVAERWDFRNNMSSAVPTATKASRCGQVTTLCTALLLP